MLSPKYGHKVCLICKGVKECPEDCQLGDSHDKCSCFISDEAIKPIDPLSSPRQSLYDLHVELCFYALRLMKDKNHDYASEDDPYRNFRTFGELGILVRLSDKLARLRSWTENKTLKVADESVRDTVLDAINYLILFEGYRNEG